jgi:hypothetical protein
MDGEETPRKGSGGAGAFVSDVKELRGRARSHIEQGAVTGAAIVHSGNPSSMDISNAT